MLLDSSNDCSLCKYVVMCLGLWVAKVWFGYKKVQKMWDFWMRQYINFGYLPKPITIVANQQLGLGRAKARPEIWPAGHAF